MYFKKTQVVVPEMFGLACRVGAHNSRYAHDTRLTLHVNPERSFRGTNGDPPSEARQLRKGGPGVLPRKLSKTYIANGAISVIPELY